MDQDDIFIAVITVVGVIGGGSIGYEYGGVLWAIVAAFVGIFVSAVITPILLPAIGVLLGFALLGFIVKIAGC